MKTQTQLKGMLNRCRDRISNKRLSVNTREKYKMFRNIILKELVEKYDYETKIKRSNFATGKRKFI